MILRQLTEALGRPQALWQLRQDSRLLAAVGRWRHGGARFEHERGDFVQFVFNVSGGQQVDIETLQQHDRGRFGEIGTVAPESSLSREEFEGGGAAPLATNIRREITAGSIGHVLPHSRVTVSGQADAVQILLRRECLGEVTSLRSATLQAAGARALVCLATGAEDELEAMVHGLLRASGRDDGIKVGGGDLEMGGACACGLPPASRLRIEAMMQGSPSVEEMADAVGLSVFHFIRAFRQTEGTTPHARLLEQRIERALSLLMQPGARVAEIGEATGFDSPSHFISSFRRRTGVTPGAVRDAANL